MRRAKKNSANWHTIIMSWWKWAYLTFSKEDTEKSKTELCRAKQESARDPASDLLNLKPPGSRKDQCTHSPDNSSFQLWDPPSGIQKMESGFVHTGFKAGPSGLKYIISQNLPLEVQALQYII